MNTLVQKNPLDPKADTPVALHETLSTAEETLRLLARLPAPQGLAERVKAGLRAGQQPSRTVAGRARILAWPAAWQQQNAWLRGAAAAAIALVVAGGGWGVYSRVAPLQPQGAAVLPQGAAQSGFSSAGAVRRPQTLNRPVVKRPAASASQAANTAAKPAARPKPTPVHRSKAVSTATPAVTPSAVSSGTPAAPSTEE